MEVNWVALSLVVGGLLAAILVDVSYLFVGDWSGSAAGGIAAVAIIVAILGGVALFLANTVIGIAREW